MQLKNIGGTFACQNAALIPLQKFLGGGGTYNRIRSISGSKMLHMFETLITWGDRSRLGPTVGLSWLV